MAPTDSIAPEPQDERGAPSARDEDAPEPEPRPARPSSDYLMLYDV